MLGIFAKSFMVASRNDAPIAQPKRDIQDRANRADPAKGEARND